MSLRVPGHVHSAPTVLITLMPAIVSLLSPGADSWSRTLRRGLRGSHLAQPSAAAGQPYLPQNALLVATQRPVAVMSILA